MYPRVIIHLQKLQENAARLVGFLAEKGIQTVAVTKVFGADPRILKAYYDGGIRHFADARIQNLARISPAYGSRMLLRIPMQSELQQVITHADISLQSDIHTIRKLNEEAKRQDKTHQILLMIDLGDLREGVYERGEMREMAKEIASLSHIDWIGTGTNLTCYGGVLPTKENLTQLLETTRWLREETGLSLPVISAGNSSSLYLTEEEGWPEGLNQLRIGEALALGTEAAYGRPFLHLHTDCFELEAEIVESRVKPSMPIGTIGKNAFGETPVFEDKGDCLRAIVAVGRQDADAADLVLQSPCMQILGASSDHMILDAGSCANAQLVEVGKTLRFWMNYRAVLRAFTSEYVDRYYEEPNDERTN